MGTFGKACRPADSNDMECSEFLQEIRGDGQKVPATYQTDNCSAAIIKQA